MREATPPGPTHKVCVESEAVDKKLRFWYKNTIPPVSSAAGRKAT